MEYKKTIPLTHGEKIREIQILLNRARGKAEILVKNDFSNPRLIMNPHYFQPIHHMDIIPSQWSIIAVDGYYGNQTEQAVLGFQKFLFITQNGIVGNTTYDYLAKLADLDIRPRQFLSKGNMPSQKKNLNSKGNPALEFVEAIVMGWNNMTTPLSQILFFVGQGFIVFLERNNNMTLHANWNQIAKEFLFPGLVKQGQWFRVNNKSFYRNGFQSYKISKSVAHVSNFIETQSRKLGVIGLVIETMDVAGKIFKGEFKFIDGAKIAFDSIYLGLDIVLKDIKTISLPIKQVITQYGKHVTKWKYVAKVSGKTSAGAITGATAAGTVVVFIQCVGAFMTGWELGTWIEKKTHIGEKAVDFCWELFIGDIVDKFYEWKTNRIVCVRYPDDWTDSQIKEFQSKFK